MEIETASKYPHQWSVVRAEEFNVKRVKGYRIRFILIKYVLSCIQTLNALVDNKEHDHHNKDDAERVKFYENSQLSYQSESYKHAHNYYACVRIAEFLEINRSWNRLINASNSHQNGIQVLS
jgi:hypothetical protein